MNWSDILAVLALLLMGIASGRRCPRPPTDNANGEIRTFPARW